MILNKLTELRPYMTGEGGLLGVDCGSKTLGLAVSDRSYLVATPLLTIRRRKFSQDVAEIEQIITERAIVGIVIGLPLNMDGSEGRACQSARAIGQNLAQHLGLPVAFRDERRSSKIAHAAMLQADLSRAKRAKKVDKIAASVILQSALNILA